MQERCEAAFRVGSPSVLDPVSSITSFFKKGFTCTFLSRGVDVETVFLLLLRILTLTKNIQEFPLYMRY